MVSITGVGGFWSDLLSSYRGGVEFFTPRVEYLQGDELVHMLNDPTQLTVAQLWRTQPHLRTVVSFVARNVAQLGVPLYERADENDRVRVRGTVAESLLNKPDDRPGVTYGMTRYELIYALVGDILLYDRAYWWVAPSNLTQSGWRLVRLPPAWVEEVWADPFTLRHYRVWMAQGKYEELPPERVLPFPGFDPAKMHGASPAVEALKDTLKEQIEAALYRKQVWKRGGRVSAVIERPKDAPRWSPEGLKQFREDWYAKFTGNGPGAGGTPILEDGMQLKRIDFSAREQEFVDAAKLSLATVASAFHVNPTMVGLLENANYSNVREFRKGLYGDTLGPLLTQLDGRLNGYFLPMLGEDNSRRYFEFNIREKLQGNFEEESQAIQHAVGGPWMTRNEGRALQNLPGIGPDGDVLLLPLNLNGAGGSQEGQDTEPAAPPPPEEAGRAPQLKSVRLKTEPQITEQYRRALVRFFEKQRSTVLSRLGAKDVGWWHEARWDTELAELVGELHTLTATTAGRAALARAERDPDGYDEARTVAFLAEAARRSAGNINAVTRAKLEEVLAAAGEDDDATEELGAVFTVAVEHRAPEASNTLATFATGFGAVEAARQSGGSRATKTWRTTSGNPRASHAAMDGETVPLDDNFSNGLPWPGALGDPDEVAGCQCELEVNIP